MCIGVNNLNLTPSNLFQIGFYSFIQQTVSIYRALSNGKTKRKVLPAAGNLFHGKNGKQHKNFNSRVSMRLDVCMYEGTEMRHRYRLSYIPRLATNKARQAWKQKLEEIR